MEVDGLVERPICGFSINLNSNKFKLKFIRFQMKATGGGPEDS